MIEARLQGVELPHEEEAAPTGGKVIDLMAALENSVRAAKESRGERGTAEETEAEVRTLPVRKTAKKAPAKKAAPARKATGSAAKKTAASPKEAEREEDHRRHEEHGQGRCEEDHGQEDHQASLRLNPPHPRTTPVAHLHGHLIGSDLP